MACVWPLSASALPATQTAEVADGNARLDLTVLEQTILHDSRSFCSVHVAVSQGDAPFAAGDSVRVWVWEDDLAGDDELWFTVFDVSPEEIQAGQVDRSFDCSAEMASDFVGGLEIYASAEVSKAACGWLCDADEPVTDVLPVVEIEDDAAEEDDTAQAANNAGPGVIADRIGTDPDWLALTVDAPSRVVINVMHLTNAGRLDAVLMSEGNEPMAMADDGADRAAIQFEPLQPGRYLVRVVPRGGGDYNFYDVEIQLGAAQMPDCEIGARDEQPCGACGTQGRTCGPGGEWGPFGRCHAEGVCSPGDANTSQCGRCGALEERCSDACEWVVGACEDEGECEPGAQDTEACANDSGERIRLCSNTCHWGDWGACVGGECPAGQSRGCYTGPLGTEGVGACRPGVQGCNDGAWGDCADEVLPTDEICNDQIDNDCNGAADGADPQCAEGQCPEGSARSCYPGPEGTEGTGPCRPGRHQCVGGTWGECEGAVIPATEICDDATDNDCDGRVDQEDRDCVSGGSVGDPCGGDADCRAPFTCVQAPEHPVFVNGYCSVVGCTEPCAEGTVCSDEFGDRFCVVSCRQRADCREDGYLCLLTITGDRACLPRCQDDSDCQDLSRSVCDLSRGVCIEMHNTIRDAGNGNFGGGFGGGGAGGGASGADSGLGIRPRDENAGGGGCNCRLSYSGRATPWLMIWALIGGLGWRRRRSSPRP